MKTLGRVAACACVIATVIAGGGWTPTALADPPLGPKLTFIPVPDGIKVNITDNSQSISWCTFTSDWFTAPPFLLFARDTYPLVVPYVPADQPRNVEVSCDNGATTHTTYPTTESVTTTTAPPPAPFGTVATVTDNTFAADVLGAEFPTLVAFQKPTCVDCANFDPVLADVAAEGGVKVVTLDVEQNPDTPETYGIVTPPCPDCGSFISPLLVLFRDGAPVDKIKIKKPDGSLITKGELIGRLGV